MGRNRSCPPQAEATGAVHGVRAKATGAVHGVLRGLLARSVAQQGLSAVLRL